MENKKTYLPVNPYEYGYDVGRANDWVGLFGHVYRYFSPIQPGFEDFPLGDKGRSLYKVPNNILRYSDVERWEAEDWIKRILTGRGTTQGLRENLIDRKHLELHGFDLQKATREEFEAKYKWLVDKGVKYEITKEVDDLAVAVNNSARRAVFESGLFEWHLYLKSCKRAGKLIYGPNYETIVDKLIVPDKVE